MLTPPELALLAAELAPALDHARIRKVFELSPGRILLRLATRSRDDAALSIVLEGPCLRVVLLEERPETPRHPGPFCEVLRALLTGAKIVGTARLGEDRILEIRVEVRQGDRTAERRLILELFSASRNLIVTDDRDTILAVRRSAPERGLAVGATYVAPPTRKSSGPTDPPFSFLPSGGTSASLSSRIEAFAGPREGAAELDELRVGASRELTQRRKKIDRLLEKLEVDRADDRLAAELRHRGELLKGALGSIGRGSATVRVMDWAAPEPTEVEIELDPRTPVAEQVEALFERARKLDRAGPRIDARIEETQLERGRLCAAIARLDAAATLEDAESVIATARREGWLPRERRVGPEGKKEPAAAPERKAYRTHHARDGWQILVGRSASDNDELTFKVANGNDYWFHVAGSPGSHVVARGPGEISGDTLLDAAMMAAVHSKAAGSGKVEVSYTRKKWVSKFRGARAGQVQMAQRKTMMVRIDEERVAAIRARPAAESGD